MYSNESGLGVAPAVAVGVGAKIIGAIGGIFKGPVPESEQLRRNQVAYELAAQGDTDALAYLKARGGITAPISGNLLSKQFGSTDGYMGSPGSKYPKVGPDAKAKALAIMGAVTGGTTMTSPVQPGQAPAQAGMFGGISPTLGIALGLGILLATTRRK